MKNVIIIILFSFMTLLLQAQHRVNKHADGSLRISVKYSGLKSSDTLKLFIYSHFYPSVDSLSPATSYATMDKDSSFRFKLSVKSDYGYFQIVKIIPRHKADNRIGQGDLTNDGNMSWLSPVCYWEIGDNICLCIKTASKDDADFTEMVNRDRIYRYKYQFSGKGSIKYTARFRAERALRGGKWSSLSDGVHIIDPLADSKKLELSVLQKYKKRLTESSYYVLSADILFENPMGGFLSAKGDYYYALDSLYKYSSNKPKPDFSYYDNVILANKMPPAYLARSRNAALYILNYFRTKYEILKGKRLNGVSLRDISDDSIYRDIRNNFSGVLRDKLIATFFLNPIGSHGNDKNIYMDALGIVKTAVYHDKIQSLFETRSIGRLAPMFNLPDTSGVYHALSDYRGKIVVVDFWFTGCGACELQYKNVLSKVEKRFERNDSVVFISISADVNKIQWLKSLRQGSYSGPDAINLFTEGKGANHHLIANDYILQGFPTMAVIDGLGQLFAYNIPELYEENGLVDIVTSALNKATYIQ